VSVVSELNALRGARARATQSPVGRGDDRAALLFLAPWLVGLLFITVGPMVASAYLSFTEYSLLDPPRFIGLDNYAEMLHDPQLHNSLKVTFTYVLVSVPLQLAVALGLAILLDRGLRGLAFYRSLFYLPSLLGGSVAIAILWRQIFGVDGLAPAGPDRRADGVEPPLLEVLGLLR
jgi:multiple sugar transport system permease protein